MCIPKTVHYSAIVFAIILFNMTLLFILEQVIAVIVTRTKE